MTTIQDNSRLFNAEGPVPTHLLVFRDLENGVVSIAHRHQYSAQTRPGCCFEFLESARFLLTKEIMTLTVLGVAASAATIGINERIREPSKVKEVAAAISTLLSLAFFGKALFKLVQRAFDSEGPATTMRV